MKNWIRPLLCTLAGATLASCSSIPFVGPGSLDLTVRGVELDQVVSVYVIVADEAELADLEDPRTIEKVVRPERHAKYVSFAQLKPVKGKSWLFEQRTLKPESPQVEHSVAKKAPEIEVEISRKLLEPHPQLSAAVVVNCGAQGWGAYPRITSFQIDSLDELELEVRGPAVVLAGQAGQAALPAAPQ